MPDESVIPIVAQNGEYSSVYLVYKINDTEDLCVYGVTCDDENAYVLTNTKVFGDSDNALSYNEFSALTGTTCAADASYDQNIGYLKNALSEILECSSDEAALLRQDQQIGGTPVSEFIAQKALYFVNFE